MASLEAEIRETARAPARGPDRLGLLLAGLGAVALAVLPFATFRANRIVPGQGRGLFEAIAPSFAWPLALALGLVALVALWRSPPVLRLVAALAGLGLVLVGLGLAPAHLTPAGNTYARVAPGSGFWLLVFALALLATDALARLRPPPLLRVALLAAAALALFALFRLGLWDDLSVMKEYRPRADAFARELGTHAVLALGSLLAAVAVGLPLGILCHRAAVMREPVLGLLNIVQTIPSIALFGLLIAPLGWVALNVPGARTLGIAGIGAAPALVALFLYSLLPMVANTVAGLAAVPFAAHDAARGLGMTAGQRLFRVELPLALPVILTGVRITLVQNIGLATVAALIGGGGLGVFVFQGLGQTAMDLVLLGALPTVALAFSAAVLLDAAVELVQIPQTQGSSA
ncbi:ABC transporter permease [Aureimonas sp. AU40]|uniref:ABC transporter permease n=1 Tax=Aureimonas sp. AU40 TaxID=1637747 RepID=UPI0007812637|nr:ABC transporter permease [Aureimonas sp. AU40]